MDGGINKPVAFFYHHVLKVNHCCIFFKKNFNKYFFLEIYLKFRIDIFMARVNGRSFRVLYGCHLKQ